MSHPKIISLYQSIATLCGFTYDEKGILSYSGEVVSHDNKELMFPYQGAYTKDSMDRHIIYSPGHEAIDQQPSWTVKVTLNALSHRLNAAYMDTIMTILERCSSQEEKTAKERLLYKGIPVISTADVKSIKRYFVYSTEADDEFPKLLSMEIGTNRTVDGEKYTRVLTVTSPLLENLVTDRDLNQLVPDDIKVSKKALTGLIAIMELIQKRWSSKYPSSAVMACLEVIANAGNEIGGVLNTFLAVGDRPLVQTFDTTTYFQEGSNKDSIQSNQHKMLSAIKSAPYNTGSVLKRAAKKVSLIPSGNNAESPPWNEDPQPAAPQNAPANQSGNPSFQQPAQPAAPQSSPAMSKDEKEFMELQSLYGATNQPGPTNGPQNTYANQPGIGQLSQVQPQPIYNTQPPAYYNQQPVYYNQQPVYQNQQPVYYNQPQPQPVYYNNQPQPQPQPVYYNNQPQPQNNGYHQVNTNQGSQFAPIPNGYR